MVEAGDENAEPHPPSSRATSPTEVAADSTANEWTDRGVVAQLGEHLHGMQGVGQKIVFGSRLYSAKTGLEL